MIPTPQMRAWLTDPAAVARTVTEIDRFNSLSRDSRFAVELDSRLPEAEDGGAESVLALAREFLRADSALAELMTAILDAAAANPFFRPPFKATGSEVHAGLVLYRRASLAIQLAVMSAEGIATKRAYRDGPSSIIFTGRRSVFRFLDAGGATLSFWESPEPDGRFSASSGARCRLLERRRIEDGETIEMDGRRHGFIVDHAPRDLCYLEAFTPLGGAPLSLEFDSRTHALTGASCADDASSRTQMMLTLLRCMDRRDAVPVFLQTIANDHFYARWHAMRELLALDAEAALPELRRMAETDEHPEVRAAAADTLSRFFAEELEEEEAVPCLS